MGTVTLARLAAQAGALVLVATTGWALSTLVPEIRREGRLHRLGWAWLLGTAWLGLAAFAVSFVLRDRAALRPALWFALAAVAIVAGTLGRGRSGERCVPMRRWGIVPLVIGVVTVVALLWEAVALPNREFDGRMTWGAQARWIAAAGSVLPEVLVNPAWSVDHPRYPPLMPILQGLPMQLAGELEDSRIPRPMYPPFLAALALVLHSAARKRAGAFPAAAVTTLLLLTPFVVFENHGGAKGTYSDLPLGAFLFGAFALLTRARPSVPASLAVGLLLGAAASSKNEGFPLAGAVLLAAFLRAGRARPGRLRAGRATLATCVCAACAALVLAWKARIPNRNDEDYLTALRHHPPAAEMARHLSAGFGAAARHLLAPKEWGLLWPAVLVLVMARRPVRAESAPVLVVIGTEAVLSAFAWAVHWAPAGLANVTASRAGLQVIGPALLLAATSLRDAVTHRSGQPQRRRA